jgi:hypothetical protein
MATAAAADGAAPLAIDSTMATAAADDGAAPLAIDSAMDTAAADDGTAPLAGQSAAATAAEDAPRHHPDTWRNVLIYVAAAGHTREAARATLATPDLRHDPELLSRIAHVATREIKCYRWCPPGCFPKPGLTLLGNAVKRDNTARAAELLAACPTPAARRELLEAHAARYRASPLRFGTSAEMVRLMWHAESSPPAVDVATVHALVFLDHTDALAELLAALDSVERCRELVSSELAYAKTGAMAQLLLDAGADVHATRDLSPLTHGDAATWDAFGVALELESPEMLEVVLAALGSADARRERVNRLDARGRPSIMLAQYDALVPTLLAAGADVHAVDNTVLFHCAGMRHRSVATLLAAMSSDDVRRATVNLADSEGVTPLMRVHDSANALALLAAGADVRALDNEGRDAVWHELHADRVYGSTSDLIATLLAAMGTDDARRESVNRANADGVTPLMRVRNLKDAQALLAAGADVSALDNEGHDVVWHVLDGVYASTSDLIATLLAAMGTDDARRESVNRADADGVTPLMLVRDLDDAQALLAAGADVSALDNQGRDAVRHAVGYRDHDVTAALLAAMDSDDARRESVNRPDAEGVTPLMIVTNGDQAEVLLAAGVDVREIDIPALIDRVMEEDADNAEGPFGFAGIDPDGWICTFMAKVFSPEELRLRVRAHSFLFIHYALTCGTWALKFVLDSGADVLAVNDAGRDAFSLVWPYTDIFRMLLGALASDEERRSVMERPDVVARAARP